MGLRVIGGANTRVEYQGAGNDGANRSSYTFNGVSLGDAVSRKHIIVAFWCGSLLGTPGADGPDACTINGVAATLVEGVGSTTTRIWIAACNTDTSGTVVVSRSAGSGMSIGHIDVWAAYDLKSATPIDTALGGFTGPATGSLDTQGGGIAVAAASATNASALTFAWTGLLVDEAGGTVGGTAGGTSRYSAASKSKTLTETLAIESDTTVNCRFIAASFR